VGIARRPDFIFSPRAAGPDHVSGRAPLSFEAADMETAALVTRNGVKCATVEIGTAAVLTAALPPLCVRVRMEVAKTTMAGDHQAPLWCP